MHQETSFISLLIVIAVAALVPVITTQLRRVHLPIVVGEIIAGMIIGKSGFNLVGDDPWLEMLSTLGFVYLMFLSGLEVDFDAVAQQFTELGSSLKANLKSPLILAILSFLLSLVVAFLSALVLQAMGLVKDVILMSLILSTTSLGLVVPVLKERGELRSRYGQTLLLASLVADFATMLFISIYVLFHTNGLSLEMLLVLVLLGVFVSFYRILLRIKRHPPMENLFNRVSAAASHMPVRAAFAIALAFIALAEQLGIEAILGAFLGGALIALLNREDDSSLRQQLDDMGYNFFIPLFFVTVGVNFDLRAVLSSTQTLLLFPLLLIMAYGIKLLPAQIFRLSYDGRRAVGAGLILSSRLSLIIAASTIGVDMGLVSPSVNSVIILLAIVTCTLSPLLYNRIVPVVREEEPEITLILGDRQVSESLALRLALHGDKIVLGVVNGAPLPAGLGADIKVIQFEAISQDSLKAAGADRARTFVALFSDDSDNLRACQIAASSFRVPHIIAQVNEPANAEAFTAAGAQPVSIPEAQITVLENLVQTPNMFRLLSHTSPNQEVIELKVGNPAIHDMPIHALRLPGRAVLMVIQRQGRFIPPRGDTQLALGDVVTVLASPEEVDQVCDILACA